MSFQRDGLWLQMGPTNFSCRACPKLIPTRASSVSERYFWHCNHYIIIAYFGQCDFCGFCLDTILTGYYSADVSCMHLLRHRYTYSSVNSCPALRNKKPYLHSVFPRVAYAYTWSHRVQWFLFLVRTANVYRSNSISFAL